MHIAQNARTSHMVGFHVDSHICDRLRENPAYGILCENLVCYIFDKYYHRANLPPSLRPIVRFAIPPERSLCTRTTNVIIEKSWSKGVVASSPGPLGGRRGPGTHCLRMRQLFPYTVCISTIGHVASRSSWLHHLP